MRRQRDEHCWVDSNSAHCTGSLRGAVPLLKTKAKEGTQCGRTICATFVRSANTTNFTCITDTICLLSQILFALCHRCCCRCPGRVKAYIADMDVD